jgi:RNA polymerase sigma factor (sigma-70 family)
MDDWSLLQEYAHRGSKEALDSLVRSYLPMVYAAALRRVRDRHLAEDVTQIVFLVLMRRATRIKKSVVLGGWLYQVTAFTAANVLRSERRRRSYEQKAAAMKIDETEAPASGPEWIATLDGVIDGAIASMPRKYRDAVVMRYFQGKSIHEVAEAQHLTDNAARQRLFRALAKLRRRLARNGVLETEDGIGAILTAAGAVAPPGDVAGRVLGSLHTAAVAKTLTPVLSAVLRSLIMAKLKSSLLVAVILLILLGVGGGVLYTITSGPVSPSAAPPIAVQPAQPGLVNPTAPSPVDVTPNGAVINTITAFRDGNVDTMIAQFESLTPDQQDSLRKVFDAVSQLRSALSARFGKMLAERFLEAVQIDPTQSDINSVRRVQPKIDGDRAQMTIPRMGVVDFVKIDGVWKLKAGAFQSTLSQLSTAAPMLEKVAALINDGNFANIAAVRAEFQKEFWQTMDTDPNPPPDRPVVLAPGKTPQETLAAFDWANLIGDEDAAISCLLNPTPGQQKGMRFETQLYHAGEQVRAAVAEKFGPSAARDTVLRLGFDTGLSKSLLDSVPVAITADKAQVDLQHLLGVTLNLQKADGVWKIEPIWDMKDPPSAWGVMLHDRYLPLLKQLTADVEAGKFPKRKQLDAAVQKFNVQIKADHERLADSTPSR